MYLVNSIPKTKLKNTGVTSSTSAIALVDLISDSKWENLRTEVDEVDMSHFDLKVLESHGDLWVLLSLFLYFDPFINLSGFSYFSKRYNNSLNDEIKHTLFILRHFLFIHFYLLFLEIYSCRVEWGKSPQF